MILNPGRFPVQTISLLCHTLAISDYTHIPEHSYSPMILTNTRFRRRPSNSP
jgi:hypothetical protein